jgi:hypothetical protein
MGCFDEHLSWRAVSDPLVDHVRHRPHRVELSVHDVLDQRFRLTLEGLAVDDRTRFGYRHHVDRMPVGVQDIELCVA